jgi:predicted ATPase
MSRIRIKNFGPIKEGCLENDGWIEIGKVTILIGNQGSGKSTVAKLISTFLWMEKALSRGDYPAKWFERKNKFKNQFLSYHRLENYMPTPTSGDSSVEYEGNSWRITYKNGSLSVIQLEKKGYSLPQIIYVPAERNFIAYVKTPKELRLSSESLKEFITEFDEAKASIKAGITLPLDGSSLEYDRLNDTLSLKGVDYKIKLSEASSGFQSFAPLYMVSRHLANTVAKTPDEKQSNMSSEEMQRFQKDVEEIYSNKDLTDEERRAAVSALSKRFRKTAFINIVEEPEQNLFPSSQWEMLQALLEFNSLSAANKLIATTHSPYLVGYLGAIIQGNLLRQKILSHPDKKPLLEKLDKLISPRLDCPADLVRIYQLNSTTGGIKKLPDYEGIPSDRNYLNEHLSAGNKLFDQLLELEEELA